MTDKNIPWNGDYHLGAGEPTTPAEKAFLLDAERIAEEVAGMTDADVADYLVEHDLQDLVTPERVDALMASALEGVRQRHQGTAPSEQPPPPAAFAVRAKSPDSCLAHIPERLTANAGANVIRPVFAPRRDPNR